MENYDRYKELTEESANAAGTADKKYEAYMDSMEAATKRLTNAWEEFTLKLKSSTIMKVGINLLADFVENMDKLLATTRILIPLIFSNKIKNFMGNTYEKGKDLFGRAREGLGFGVKQTSFIKDESGKIVSTSVGRGGTTIVKAGFSQLHQDLEELIGVTKGKVMGTAAEVGAKAIGKNKFQVGSDVAAEWDSVNKRWRGRNIVTGRFAHLTPDQLQSLPDMQSVAGAKFGFFRRRTLKGVTLADGAKLTTRKGDWFDSAGNSIKLTEAQQKEVAAITAQNKENYAAAFKSSIAPSLVMGVLTGLMTGFGQKSYAGGDSLGAKWAKAWGVKSGDQQVESAGSSVAKGFASGIGAGVSMLPPPWNLIGPVISMLGPLLTDFVSTWIHRDELERKERSEQAQKQLDALNGIQSTIEDSADLMSKDVWVSDDYKAFKEYIDGLNQSYLDMEGDFAGATDTFIANFNEAARKLEISTIKIGNINDLYDQLADANIEVRKKAQRAIELANLQAQREQYVKSQEDALYQNNKASSTSKTLNKIISYADFIAERADSTYGAEKTSYQKQQVKTDKEKAAALEIRKLFDNEQYDEALNKAKELSETIGKGNAQAFEEEVKAAKKAQKEIDAYKKKVAEMDVEIGVLAADIWDFSDDELSALTMDGIMAKVVAAMGEQGVAVRNAAGYIKDEYIAAIQSAIKSNSQFNTLLKGDTRTMSQLADAANKFKRAFGSRTYAEVKDMLDRGMNIKEVATSEYSGYDLNELAEIVYAADPSKIQNFARAWNVTTEGAEKLSKRFKDLTTAEGLMSNTEIVEKYSNLNNIFEDLADNTALTAENFNKMIELYPQLISNSGSLTDLYDKIVNQQALSLANSLWTEMLTGESVGKDFKEKNATWIKGLENSFPDLAKAIGKNGFTITNLLELAEQYSTGDEKQKGIAEQIKTKIAEYFEYIPDVEITNPALEKAIEYQERLWKKQISNLEEQKDALSKVNEEREKELNLMKAQEQLENARKEKKMVYREGVGFVYEADESAISEAQKNLEALDTQKRQDEIQAEIDRLNYLQETLDALKDDQELAKLKTAFDTYASAQKENGNKLGENTEAVLKLADALDNQKISFKYDKNGALVVTLPDGSNESFNTGDSIDQETKTALKTLATQRDILDDKAKTLASLDATKSPRDYNKAVGEYNTALDNYNTTKSSLSGKVGAGTTMTTASGEETTYGDFTKDDSGLTKKDESKIRVIPSLSQPDREKTVDWGNHSGGKTMKWNEWTSKGEIWLNPNATQYDMKWQGDDGASYDFDHHRDFTVIKRYNAKDDSWGDWEGYSGDYSSLPDYTIITNAYDDDKGDQVYGFVYKGGIRKLQDADGSETVSRNALGTLSKPTSGPSYINELGTEAIITPSGTLTALPSKTGIIPADITKNLWGLGEVAPNLVGMLDSLKQQRFDTEAKTITNEEGVYIDRLDMSIYPKEGYNMDEFISQLRAKAALTRQNN